MVQAFRNSVILLAKMSKIPNLLQLSQMPSNASMNTELYSQNLVDRWTVLHYLGNTLLFTMSILFMPLVRWMDFAHPLRSQNTSRPWRRLGIIPAASKLLVRCCWQTRFAASCVDFAKRGMLDGTCIESMLATLSMYPHIVFVIVLMNSCWFSRTYIRRLWSP